MSQRLFNVFLRFFYFCHVLYVFTVFDYYLNERFYIYDQYYINNIVLKYAYMPVLIKS